MFEEIERETSIRDSALTHAFVHALERYWKKHRSIKLPLRLASDDETEFHAQADENGASAKVKKRK